MKELIKKTISEIKQSIKYSECNEDDNEVQVAFVIDRYHRHDHGGGEDGDEWLDSSEINEDYRQGASTHQSKLTKVNSILSKNGFKPSARFDLGEKGHFSIDIHFEKE